VGLSGENNESGGAGHHKRKRADTKIAKLAKKPAKAAEETLWDEVAALKRERILAEAAKLIAERGYHGTTIDAIAEKFGATKPFVYYHFESKADLLAEICQRGTVRALEAAGRAMSAKGSPRERLEQFVTDFTSIALQNHACVAVYFREEINLPKVHADRINKMRKEIDRKLTKLLEEGVRAGEFKVDDPQICCLVIAGMISYAFAWYRDEGRLSTDKIASQMRQLVRNMVT